MAVNGTSAVMAAPTSAVDPQVAAAMELQGRLDPLRDALGLADLTPAEMSLFAMVALHSRLDPFAKQIYAIKRKGKVTFQTGIDGFRGSAEETGQYRGSDEPLYGPWIDKPWGHPEYATVVVHRALPDGTTVDQSATAYWDEFVADPGQDFQWKKMPRVMLAKCAEAAAFRKAFPKRFGQVYEGAEMDQAASAESARPVEALTHRDRIAQQRAELEAQTTSAAPEPSERQQARDAGAGAPDATAEPVTVPAPSGAVAGEAAIEGEVIDGTATVVDAGDGMGAGDLRQWLRDRLIGISEAREVGMRLFGKDSLDRLTDAERGAVRRELETKAAGS